MAGPSGLALLLVGVVNAAEVTAVDKVGGRSFDFPQGYVAPADAQLTLIAGPEGREIWVHGPGLCAKALRVAVGDWRSHVPAGGRCSAGMHYRPIQDPYDPGAVWLPIGEWGLENWNLKSNLRRGFPTQYFSGGVVLRVAPDKDWVWIGTTAGLFRLHRGDWRLDRIDDSGQLTVWDIHLEQSRAVINGSVALSRKTGRAEESIALPEEGEVRWIDWKEGLRLSATDDGALRVDDLNAGRRSTFPEYHPAGAFEGGQGLWLAGGKARPRVERMDSVSHRMSESYETAARAKRVLERPDELLVTYGRQVSRINRLSGVEELLVGEVLDVLLLGESIWLLTPNGLVALTAEQLAQAFEWGGTYTRAMEMAARYEANMRQRPPAMRIKMAAAIAQLTSAYPDSSRAQGLRIEARKWLMITRESEVDEAEALVRESGGEQSAMAVYSAAASLYEFGRPRAALAWAQRMRVFPGTTAASWLAPGDVDVMGKAAEAETRIEKADYSPDERLWRMAEAYLSLDDPSWSKRRGDALPKAAERFMISLRTLHPTSPFAIMAETEMQSRGSD